MKFLFFMFVFMLGYLGHVVVEEAANFRVVRNYKKCVGRAMSQPNYNNDGTLSAWQQCKHLLEYNIVENILLYEPRFWDDFSR